MDKTDSGFFGMRDRLSESWFRCVVFLVLLALPTAAAAAATATTAGTGPTNAPPSGVASGVATNSPTQGSKPTWTLPVPIDGKFDWVKLTSGEWLKGDIRYLRRDSFEFDSDELDVLSLDWEDVAEVYSPRPNTISLEGRVTATGKLSINRDTVVLSGGLQPLTFPRNQLNAIIPGEPKEKNYWSGKGTIGVGLNRGNVNQADLSTSLSLTRRTPNTRFSFDYLGNYSAVESRVNANNHRATAKFDVFLTRRLYVSPAYLELYRDPFQNIAYRLTPAVGVGYTLIDTKKIEWDVNMGVGFQGTEYESVEANQDNFSRNTALLPSTMFDYEITGDIDLTFEYSGQYAFGNYRNIFHHSVTKLSFDITRIFDLDVSFIWDRNSNPRPDENGAVPLENDFRLTLGFGYDF